MRNLRIAELLFNRPLMISEGKLNVILHALGPRFNLDMTALPVAQMAQISDQERNRAGYTIVNGVAIIGVYGPLMHRVMASDYPSGGPTTYGEIIKAFDTAMQDDAARELFMMYDTPGGEVHGAFDAADHIFQARGQKPITAVINESAYSAGYLLASSANRIVIPRTGGAGSIGVIATHADFSRAENEAGVTVTHVIAGARKADFSPHAPLSDPAFAALQCMVNDTYDLFAETVARNRKMSVKDVKATEAGIFEGKKAVTARLADEVQPADKAIASARRQKTIFTATGRTAGAHTTNKEITKMDARTLKQEHPEAVAEIEAAAREGMITQQAAASGGSGPMCGTCSCKDCTSGECSNCTKNPHEKDPHHAAAFSRGAAAEQTRVLGLVSAAFGEDTGKKFAAVAGKGLSADDMAALGISFAPSESGDAASRAAILAAVIAGAPAGLKGTVVNAGITTPVIDSAAIYAGRQKK